MKNLFLINLFLVLFLNLGGVCSFARTPAPKDPDVKRVKEILRGTIAKTNDPRIIAMIRKLQKQIDDGNVASSIDELSALQIRIRALQAKRAMEAHKVLLKTCFARPKRNPNACKAAIQAKQQLIDRAIAQDRAFGVNAPGTQLARAATQGVVGAIGGAGVKYALTKIGTLPAVVGAGGSVIGSQVIKKSVGQRLSEYLFPLAITEVSEQKDNSPKDKSVNPFNRPQIGFDETDHAFTLSTTNSHCENNELENQMSQEEKDDCIAFKAEKLRQAKLCAVINGADCI